mgnify:CR=1 FL=1
MRRVLVHLFYLIASGTVNMANGFIPVPRLHYTLVEASLRLAVFNVLRA